MTINRKISLALGIIVIVVAGGTATTQYVQSLRYSYSAPSAVATSPAGATNPAVTISATATPSAGKTTSSDKTTTTPPAKASGTYTLTDVAIHNSGTNCWSAINGGVYDLTSWINQHPGGPQAILRICGKDGSSAFNTKHGGQNRPTNELAGFKIGTLVAQ
jgi:cytochrome b involved in lipid metabolism